jgi:uncharacterized damage-inducible protein DinB
MTQPGERRGNATPDTAEPGHFSAPAAPERTYPPGLDGDRTALEAWLEFHRATLLMKCAGLDVEQLRRRSTPPSTLSLLGLVRHMTDVERGWFLRTLWDEDAPRLYYGPGNDDGDFDDVDTADAAADLARYEENLIRVREAARRWDDLDTPVRRRRHGRGLNLRWIYLHMIEEYARHNGHADLLRERIDGSTGQ